MKFLSFTLVFLLCSGIISGQSLTDKTPAVSLVSADNFATNRAIVCDVDSKNEKTVYVWTELDGGSTRDIYCAIYDSRYTRIVNSFRVNNNTTNEQVHPIVKIHQDDNSFVVAWSSKQNGTDYDVYMKKVSLNLTNLSSSTVASTSDILVNNITSLDQIAPRLAIDYSRNELLVGFTGYESTTRDAYVRQFDYTALSPLASQFSVNPTSTGDQYLNSIEVSQLTGDLVTAYQQTPGTNMWDVYRRVFNYVSGSYSGQAALIVNNYTTNDQSNAYIVTNQHTGDYSICWTSVLQDGSGSGVYAKIFNKLHGLIKDEFLVSSSVTHNQLNVKSIWDEKTNHLVYIFHFSVSGSSTLKYRIFDNNYNSVGNEQSALWNGSAEINTQNHYLGGFFPVYNQLSRKLTIAYDLYDNFGSFSKGYIRTLEFTHSSLQPSSSCNTDTDKLWTEETTYDEYGNIVSQNREYQDRIGRTTQIQTRNISDNKILATSVLYDKQGRVALNTLPAPINETCFTYNAGFVEASGGGNYTTAHFDEPISGSNASGEIDNPVSLSNTTSGKLGWYYSDNNTSEPYVATSGYPYSRVDYNDRIVGGQVRSSEPGNSLRMGQGHESKVIVLPILSELDNHYLPIRNNYYVPNGPTSLAWQGTKTISTDQNGKEHVTFRDKYGRVLAKALSQGTQMTTVSAQLGAQLSYWNFTVPSGKKMTNLVVRANGNVDMKNFTTSVTYSGAASLHTFSTTNASESIQVRYEQPFVVTYVISNTDGSSPVSYEAIATDLQSKSVVDLYVKSDLTISANAGVTFKIYDLVKGGLISGTNTYTNAPGLITITPGLYRIRVEGVNSTRSTYSANELTLSYKFNYSEWSYVYYNNAGRIIREISPKGVDLASTAEPLKHYSKYTYNSVGWLLSMYDTDRKLTEYVYQRDGQIRFSQDAKQKLENKFSYVNYKTNGEVIEQGEYASANSGDHFFMNTLSIFNNVAPPSGISVGAVLENMDGLNDAKCSSVNVYETHKPDNTGLSATITGYVQRNVNNRISKSFNGNNVTWYSYDEQGRLEWLVQNITGLGVKTIHYEYGLLGNLRRTVYQKGTSTERFEHKYTFNGNLQLYLVKTRAGNGLLQKEALYKYYQHGPLKRTELAVDVQGVDYVYTINGRLKSINNPTLDNTKDPGKDSYSGANSAFAADVFGMQLQYFDGDYSRTNSNVTSTVLSGYQDQFNGTVKGMKWQVKGHAISGNMLMYAFNYDNKYQLTNANFGTVSAANETSFSSSTAFGISNAYDANGNLTSKFRGDAAGAGHNSFGYSYVQSSIDDNKLKILTTTNEGTRNYQYDDAGKCISEHDGTNTLRSMVYNPYDLVTEVSTFGQDAINAKFTYNERGQRIKKEVLNIASGISVITWYVCDVTGKIISVYDNASGSTVQTELPIYGKGRIGRVNKTFTKPYTYEITDHLGTVRATVNRVKSGGLADVESWADYYADGEIMPARSGVDISCRNGYQGEFAERDETKLNSFDLRMYDTKIGRWLSPDPYGQYHSPYLAMGNNPVSFVDPDGGTDLSALRGSNGATGPSPGPGTGPSNGPGNSDLDLEFGPWIFQQGSSGAGPRPPGGTPSSQQQTQSLNQSNKGDGTVYNSTGSQNNGGNVGTNSDDLGNQNKPDPEPEGDEIWYYLWKHEDPNADPKKFSSAGHSMIYDPKTGKIYEVNFANPDKPEKLKEDGLGFILFRNRKEAKSVRWTWDVSTDNGKKAFWNYRGGRGNVDVYPVKVPNPSAAREFFDNNDYFDYNLKNHNCKHYVFEGLKIGGAIVELSGPFPGMWNNSGKLGTWGGPADVGIISW